MNSVQVAFLNYLMKLANAEKARNKISAEAEALAEQSAAESEAYRKELRRIQTERERAQREAQAAEKRQREAELLMASDQLFPQDSSL